MKKKAKPKYVFYILKCKDSSLYCGITNNLEKRISAHNSGKGSVYVRSRGGGKVVFFEKCKNLSAALVREAAVKKWTRLEKLSLIKSSYKKPA